MINSQNVVEAEKGTAHTAMNRGTLHVKEIGNIAELDALSSSWNRLVERSAWPVVYLTFEWTLTWWLCHQNSKKRLLVLIVSDGPEVVGIAPFVEVRPPFLGLGTTKIEFIPMMRYAFSPLNCAATLDVIAASDRHDEVVESILDHLRFQHKGWNVVRLHPVPEQSRTIRAIESYCGRQGFAMNKRMVFANAVIRNPGEWNTYAAALSPEFRKKHRVLGERLRSRGPVEFQSCRSFAELENGFETLLDVERRSWKWKHGARLNAPVFRDFYRRFAEAAADRGWLRISLLKSNGKPVAYDYSIEYQQGVESMKSSYDELYRHYSPGNLLSWQVFERFFRDGIKRINLLWGDFPGKARWSPEAEPHYEIFIFNNDAFSGLVRFVVEHLKAYRIRRYCSVRVQEVLWQLGLN